MKYEEYCTSCKNNYNHYRILHVEECTVKNDSGDINLWENKIHRLEDEENKCFNKIDQNIETIVDSLNSNEQRSDNTYLFSSYLGSINEKKNILLNKVDTIISAYDTERSKIKYQLTLNNGDFSKKKYHKDKKVIIHFKKLNS